MFWIKEIGVENQEAITKIGKSTCSEWCVDGRVEGPWAGHGRLT